MLIDYTMRMKPHPGYPTDYRPIEHRGEFASWDAFRRFKEREYQNGWIVENERASAPTGDVR